MKKLPTTIADIALRLGVHQATVSRALRDDPRISKAMRKQVEEMARRMQYRKNKIASALRSGRSRVIGVMIPSAEINFFGRVVHGIESVAAEKGYNVLLFQSNEDPEFEQRGLETFQQARVDGILVSIAKHTRNYAHFEQVRKSGIPLVFFDRSVKKLDVSSVVVNDYRGAYTATQHLLEQGFKRIAHISGPQHVAVFRNRFRGYRDALKKNGYAFNAEWVYPGNISIASGREGMAWLLSRRKRPDGLFAAEDFTALGALKVLQEQHIKVPRDFGVIGFANEGFGEHITPTLSSFDQQTVLMGKNAMELLLELLDGKHQHHQKKIVLEAIPVFRQSSRKKS